jgi:hypothetical protein
MNNNYPGDRPTKEEMICIVLLAIVSVPEMLISPHLSFLTTAGAGSLLLALFAIFRPRVREQLIFLGFAIPFATIVCAVATHAITSITPHTDDAILSRMDGGLSVSIYHWTLQHPAIYHPLGIAYIGLPLFTALVLGLTQERMACFRSFLLAGIFAPVFYYLVPAIGPAAYGLQGTPRNCFPSLHLTWALQLVLYTRSHLSWIASVYVLIMIAATLGLGEHYIIDLVAAIPYTAAIYWLERRLSRHLPTARSQGNEQSLLAETESIIEEVEVP